MIKNTKFRKDVQKKLKFENRNDAFNKHCRKISYRIKYLKYIMCACLVILVSGGFIFRAEEITVENITHLLRYIDIVPVGRAPAREFRIEADENTVFAYYRNTIAVLRRNRLDIYDITGRRTASFPIAYSNPVINVSQRYILIYDLGRNRLEIFNPVSRVFEYTGTGPIFGARVTDRGFTVYITREPGYRSVVNILNRNFAPMYTVYRVRDFVVDADICEGARYLLMAGFYTEGGDILTSILLFRTDATEPVRDIKVRGEMPLMVKLNAAGFCVLLENSIRFYDMSGEETGRYGFSGSRIRAVELGRYYSAVILNERTIGNEVRILIFDAAGNIVCDHRVDMEITDIRFAENYNYLYALTRRGIYKINIAEDTLELFIARINARDGEYPEANYDETARRIIFANERNIILAGLSKINILEK